MRVAVLGAVVLAAGVGAPGLARADEEVSATEAARCARGVDDAADDPLACATDDERRAIAVRERRARRLAIASTSIMLVGVVTVVVAGALWDPCDPGAWLCFDFIQEWVAFGGLATFVLGVLLLVPTELVHQAAARRRARVEARAPLRVQLDVFGGRDAVGLGVRGAF
jgi:hypothetical protein